MFPLWDVAVAPVLTATGAARVVEIGALRGETTVRMLDTLGPDVELHVIDPEPEFDPTEHERAFPGRYVFHRAPSLEVLPSLPAVDAALIDGDHNWYTVYHELKLLAAAARRDSAPLPVLILHDVGWPYGRRDLYYDPERIPPEHRQPYSRAGMRPGTRTLLASGGLNPTLFNADVEGGPRNGVMTALDDFLSEHDRPVRRLVLPIYFGLAIVAEEERLERRPELVAALDHLESAEGRSELLQVAEHVRLRAMIMQHNLFYGRSDELERAREKHLQVVKTALLDGHYLENEVRLAHLTDHLLSGRPVNAERLRDPVRADRAVYERLASRRFGPSGPDDEAAASFLPFAAMGSRRLDHLEWCLDVVRAEFIEGDLAECGTGRGGGAIFMRAYLDAHEIPGTHVWVADRFRSTPEPATTTELPEDGVAGFRADLNLVRDGFERFGLLDDRVRFLIGPLGSSLRDAAIDRLALLRIGGGAEGEACTALDELYDKVTDGGFVVVEGHSGSDTMPVVAAFRSRRGITTPFERVDARCVSWRKHALDDTARAGVGMATVRAGPPLAPRAPADTVDLTVVVVFFNMRREAERTLHSLSRVYQEGIDDITYEVIVAENGSTREESLGGAFVESFGPEFRYLDLGPGAAPSPVPALNRAISGARGVNIALMIDGAHVLTPGVLRFGLAGLRTYEPAIVGTQQWYVGPGQQGDVIDDGYTAAEEDRLFEAIGWPDDGYRLFEIGHFIGDRDWLDGLWESNCLFAPRTLLEQVGGFDERFSMPGGGYANLDLYERLGSSPGVTVVTILGEGSFHQVHGGTTTNEPDPAGRRALVFGYGRHYAEQRGGPYRQPGKSIHYVGRMTSPSVRRTKARRRTAELFAAAAPVPGDGPPSQPFPVPDDLETAFTEAVWRSVPWDRTTWLGRRIRSAPTDLLAYQEVITEVRPDWIVETGTADGGRTLFLASICELVGHGEVLSVDESLADDLPHHPRIRYLRAAAHSRQGVERVRSFVGDTARVVVVLGSRANRFRTAAQFERLAPLVPVGSYVIVTDTIVNGHPVWPAFGPGPAEAVRKILTAHGGFVADPLMEKYSLTFNPGGFLRRID